MPRSVKEWIGKTPDSQPPPRVRLRVYDRFKGVCHICKLPIKPTETWHCDHVKALIEGGENREKNLAPAHAHCNLAKGQEETKRKSKANRIKAKHVGAVKPKGKLQSRGFEKTEKPAKIGKQSLPPRLLYQ